MATSDNTSKIPYGYCQCGCGQKTNIILSNEPNKGRIKGCLSQFKQGHYKRTVKKQPIKERFWPKVNKSGSIPQHCPELGNCWEWIAGKSVYGYGIFTYTRSETRAHRISWILANGEIPNGLDVLHKCDNPCCVNPEHLFLGTDKTNTDDKVSKGRQAKGENNGRCKLTDIQVEEIRERYSQGNISHRQLAKDYKVAHNTIGDIIRRKIRK